jgi:hypothetical protein
MNDQNSYYPNSQQDPYSGGQYGGNNQPPQQPAETVYGSYGNQEQPSYQSVPQPVPYQPSSQPYSSYQSPGYGQQNMYGGTPYTPVTQSSGPNGGFAIAGLVLGIVSIVLFWAFYLGIPVAIVGIIMSALGRRSVERRTMATVGLVLSIIAIVLSLCIVAFIILALLHPGSTTN